MAEVKQHPAVPKKKIRPVARAARLAIRHRLIMLSFILLVVAPASLVAWYLHYRAAEQFSSTAGFLVRSEDTGVGAGLISGLSAFTGSTSTGSDPNVLYEYIRSQQMVEELDREMDLRSLFRKPQNDPVFAFSEEGSIEDLVKYWKSMVDVNFDSGTQLIEVQVRAFSPDDAKLIATHIIENARRLVNDLSAAARNDSMRYALEDLTRAEERLAKARQELSAYRQQTRIVDPASVVSAQSGLLTTLNQQLVETTIQLDVLSQQDVSDPRTTALQKRIEVIEQRIKEEREKLGQFSESPDEFVQVLAHYEELATNMEFAEKAYVGALTALDIARANSERASRYLAVYIQPTLAERALFPQSDLILGLTVFFLLLGWFLLVLIAYSVKDRR
ncbi:MAG: sugar transporter [Paracoccaceae bacterium]